MISFFFLVFFVFSRIMLDSLWEQYSVYYSYAYELLFVAITFMIIRKRKTVKFNLPSIKNFLMRILPFFFFGFAFYQLGNHSGITIPFNFHESEILVMLLVIGPILEELIFRFAMWELFDDLIKNSEAQIWFSAIMFSLSHFMAIYLISPDLRPFVLYQSLYVIVLSIGSSRIRQETGSIVGSILLHFLFNLGFFIGSLV